MGLIRSLWNRVRGAREQTPDAVPVRLIVGLGNPGARYADTRHNIGFRILERVAERAGGAWRMEPGVEARVAPVALAGTPCLLVLPQTFMNHSGRSVDRALRRWPSVDPSRDLLVVYDDMDLETGRIRLRPRGGGGGHNGIGDVLAVLETKDVPRLRFGIGHPGRGDAVLDWVLSSFSESEEEALGAAIERAADAIELAVGEGVPAAMGQFNASG